MVDFQVTYIVKPGGSFNPHTRIRKLGGSGWEKPEDTVISEIRNRTNRYYVRNGNYSAWLEVAATAQGHAYLKTVPDNTHIDNLLFLENRAA